MTVDAFGRCSDCGASNVGTGGCLCHLLRSVFACSTVMGIEWPTYMTCGACGALRGDALRCPRCGDWLNVTIKFLCWRCQSKNIGWDSVLGTICNDCGAISNAYPCPACRKGYRGLTFCSYCGGREKPIVWNGWASVR